MFYKTAAAAALSLACASAIANPISQGVEFSLFGTVPSANFVIKPVSPEVLQGVNELIFNEATESFKRFETVFEVVSAANFTVSSNTPNKLISGTDEISYSLKFGDRAVSTGVPIIVQSVGNLDKQYFPVVVEYPAAPPGGFAPGDYTGVVSLLFSSNL